jgi:hypothetical protein
MPSDDQSWVKTRGRSQAWFNNETEHSSGVTFTRGN